jgi:hypothetical protein
MQDRKSVEWIQTARIISMTLTAARGNPIGLDSRHDALNVFANSV